MLYIFSYPKYLCFRSTGLMLITKLYFITFHPLYSPLIVLTWNFLR